MLTYTLQQLPLSKLLEGALSKLTRDALLDQLKVLQPRAVIYWGLAYTQLPVLPSRERPRSGTARLAGSPCNNYKSWMRIYCVL